MRSYVPLMRINTNLTYRSFHTLNRIFRDTPVDQMASPSLTQPLRFRVGYYYLVKFEKINFERY